MAKAWRSPLEYHLSACRSNLGGTATKTIPERSKGSPPRFDRSIVFRSTIKAKLTLDLAVLSSTDLQLSVINGLGQEVLPGTSLNIGQGANRRVIDVSKLPAGAYIIRLTMADKVQTHRFTKVD